ncbi:DNA-methyltransferase [Actinophytocola algeriensis]|uniref:Methyltransferase n=1 Tax=Actinophytocola algeriensis TaxID=1768010 RepID=A0A7W7QBF2_9PSEU|nr:site-specific DNA-methyltransferase [Actinophytocola algeriensis]MBB4910532.1 DNA modification methylase [Actinophytocola algeriensis]MBE1480479.1 DNA modification methylase [Actinophytocola algeriensis]
MSGLPLGQILVGDARERLAELPDASVDCIITSPPYWALRDYGHAEQLGAEASVDDWVSALVELCDQLARVLTPTGSLWLNLGDSFARRAQDGAPKKSLLLGPSRVALQLLNRGWLLRNQVIWHKPNAMPSSVSDRLTTTYEVVYFLTRQPHYFFDLDAIRRPSRSQARPFDRRPASYPPRSAVPSLGRGRAPRVNLNRGLAGMKAAGLSSHPLGKNPGDVWAIGTGRYTGAHFATFPLELVRRPLLATCPELVCANCSRPWTRPTQPAHERHLPRAPLQADCRCRALARRGIVLDPFMGAGTVALAAEQHGRDWLGCELNPVYAELARQRLADWRSTTTPQHQPSVTT